MTFDHEREYRERVWKYECLTAQFARIYSISFVTVECKKS